MNFLQFPARRDLGDSDLQPAQLVLETLDRLVSFRESTNLRPKVVQGLRIRMRW